MNISVMFFGSFGRIYSTSCIVLLVVVMFVMSLRLFISRRRKAYFSLTISLSFIILQYLLLLGLEFSGQVYREWFDIFVQFLKVLCFIFINFAVYQLYNSTNRKHYLYFVVMIGINLLLSYVYLRIPYVFHGTVEQVKLLQNIGFELYLIVLLMLCYVYISPYINQPRKYLASLYLYAIAELSHIINVYILEVPLTFLNLMINFLPIVYYFILFLILFNRVIELMQAVYRTAITDGLTGLYNRHYFIKKVNQYVTYEIPVTVIFCDIDNFKRLNDTEGHQAGDDALRHVAQIAMDVSDELGIAGRYGGEEIVLLITDRTIKGELVAEALRSRVEEETPVTISVGYCSYKNGLSAEELLHQADEAMYHAKTTGKNKVVKYSANLIES